ncbi:hypothetical protein GF324_14085 [bacterium]|nr:hypothetical protein [bacterium]
MMVSNIPAPDSDTLSIIPILYQNNKLCKFMSRYSRPANVSRSPNGTIMTILLINPNRYQSPPVPPIGLEYLAGALDSTGHQYQVCDLCFAENPADVLTRAIDSVRPDIAGITIRNIDTVIYQNNLFFLDDIAKTVRQVHDREVPVVLGGAGYSFMPEEILAYTGADYGIAGPGEGALPVLLDRLADGAVPERTVLDGFDMPFDRSLTPGRGELFDYERYLGSRGLAGFETQKGCAERCAYCLECRRDRVVFREPDAVVDEIETMVGRGISRFHLCDTEFNQDLGHCKRFLHALIDRELDMQWALYLKSRPYDGELFELLAASRAELVTLSLPTGTDWLSAASEQVQLARANGLKLVVDLLVGLPGQTIDEVRRIIDTLREAGPETVGVNSTIRLYKGLPVTDMIMADPAQQRYLLGETEGNDDCVRPVFYQWLTVDMLRDIIGDDPLFKIEGFERTSNYERV